MPELRFWQFSTIAVLKKNWSRAAWYLQQLSVKDHPDGCMCHYIKNIKKHTGSEHKVTVPTSGQWFTYTGSNHNVTVPIINVVIKWHLFNYVGYKISNDYKWKIGKGMKVADVVTYVVIMYCHIVCQKRLRTSIESLVIHLVMKALLWYLDLNKQLSVSCSIVIFGGIKIILMDVMDLKWMWNLNAWYICVLVI